MPEVPFEAEREHRISMEVIVDADHEIEQAMGWYYYLDDRLKVPFPAVCIARRSSSPLKVEEPVQVLGMADEEDCEHDMMVRVEWRADELAVPLAQLRPLSSDPLTVQAVADWHYWVARGYEFRGIRTPFKPRPPFRRPSRGGAPAGFRRLLRGQRRGQQVDQGRVDAQPLDLRPLRESPVQRVRQASVDLAAEVLGWNHPTFVLDADPDRGQVRLLAVGVDRLDLEAVAKAC